MIPKTGKDRYPFKINAKSHVAPNIAIKSRIL
jgi:hypothetical protein